MSLDEYLRDVENGRVDPTKDDGRGSHAASKTEHVDALLRTAEKGLYDDELENDSEVKRMIDSHALARSFRDKFSNEALAKDGAISAAATWLASKTKSNKDYAKMVLDNAMVVDETSTAILEGMKDEDVSAAEGDKALNDFRKENIDASSTDRPNRGNENAAPRERLKMDVEAKLERKALIPPFGVILKESKLQLWKTGKLVKEESVDALGGFGAVASDVESMTTIEDVLSYFDAVGTPTVVTSATDDLASPPSLSTDSTPVATTASESVEDWCAACDGKGYYEIEKKQKCEQCDGLGRKTSAIAPKPTKSKCVGCDGLEPKLNPDGLCQACEAIEGDPKNELPYKPAPIRRSEQSVVIEQSSQYDDTWSIFQNSQPDGTGNGWESFKAQGEAEAMDRGFQLAKLLNVPCFVKTYEGGKSKLTRASLGSLDVGSIVTVPASVLSKVSNKLVEDDEYGVVKKVSANGDVLIRVNEAPHWFSPKDAILLKSASEAKALEIFKVANTEVRVQGVPNQLYRVGSFDAKTWRINLKQGRKVVANVPIFKLVLASEATGVSHQGDENLPIKRHERNPSETYTLEMGKTNIIPSPLYKKFRVGETIKHKDTGVRGVIEDLDVEEPFGSEHIHEVKWADGTSETITDGWLVRASRTVSAEDYSLDILTVLQKKFNNDEKAIANYLVQADYNDIAAMAKLPKGWTWDEVEDAIEKILGDDRPTTASSKCGHCGQERRSPDCCETGSNHYLFNWDTGGYNDTHADSPEQAYEKTMKWFPTLKPAKETFKPFTIELSNELNRQWGGNFD